MEPDPQRERDTSGQRDFSGQRDASGQPDTSGQGGTSGQRDGSGQRAAEQAWSPYDELAAREDAEWRRSRRRRSLAWAGVALLVVCVVGSVGGYIWYDRTTRLDRSTPVVVVFQFVDAVFDKRNLDEAEVFECESRNASQALGELMATVTGIERQFDTHVTVSPSDFSTDIRGSNATVGASLLIDVPEADGDPSRSRQRWIFNLRDDDGWRVCDARQEK